MPRARNNLSTFDIDQIEADLMAVEAEALGLDPHSQKDKLVATNDIKDGSEAREEGKSFKPHPVNVVNFNPDNSRLLHKVLRSDIKTEAISPVGVVKDSSPVKMAKDSSRITSQNVPAPAKQIGIAKRTILNNAALDNHKSKNLKAASTPNLSMASEQRAGVKYGMDGFKKVSPLVISKPVSSTNSVALTGMKRANQFNRYALEQHGTSLQNQLEKQSLFSRSLDGDVEIYDRGLQTNGGKKVYNVGRRKSMLGGVDQHNLGPGKLRRLLTYRSMRFIMPVFALLFVGSYLMYLNMPSISIKVAENKSGVAISEPSYTPDGYKLKGPIEADTGQVAMSFKNGDAAFNVSQKVSDWDSKALLENKILKETKEYSAYTDRGLTIYVYDGKATWVNQGKVFEIKLDGSKLDVEEMIRIAGSM